MGKQRCAGCGERFDARRNVLQQRFCSKPECQRARRARWQREKMAQDADYRANQAEAGRRWRERHPQYWRAYSGEFGHLIHWKPAAHSGGKRPPRPEENGHPVIAQAKRELLLLLLFGIGCQF